MSFNVADALLAVAKRRPDRIAIDAPDRRLTYSGLIERALMFADFMEGEGVVPGDRVGIALTGNDEVVVAMLGLWFLGAAALIVDFRSRASERSRIANSAGIRFFIQDRKAPGSEPYPFFALSKDWDSLLQNRSSPRARRPHVPRENIAIIAASSGTTTGMPELIAVSHECLFARYALVLTSPQWNSSGRLLTASPLAFGAVRNFVISQLLNGGTIIFIHPLFNASTIADRVAETNADSMLTVPTVVRRLMEIAPEHGLMFPDMAWIMCTGAPMSSEENIDAHKKLCKGFIQNYGTAMTGVLTLLESDDIESHAMSVGKPLPHVLIEIVDEKSNPLPAGETGYIRIRTPGIAAKLPTTFDLDERPSETIKDGWLYPGDLGRFDENGFLHISGRATELIVRGGVKIYPAEIEEVLASHPAVDEAAVAGLPDRTLGEEISAFVVARSEVDSAELLGWCRSRLHPDKQPRHLYFIKEMPRNNNGKLERRRLREKVSQDN